MKNLCLLACMILFLASCNRVSFQPTPVTEQKLESTVPSEPELPSPIRKSGNCPDQQNVTSCLKCEVPEVPPTPPTISTKAQKLAKIMSMACQIPNASYPKDYVAPTAQEVEAHLLACTPELYPETDMSAPQSQSIETLLDEGDDSLRQKLFKGRWYQPPHTEYFETYFGLDNSEAAYVICMNQGALAPILSTKEYVQAVGSDAGYESWLHNPEAQARWQAAQKQRQQLLSCFNKPGTATVTPKPSIPVAQTCDYRSFEGLFELGGQQEILSALEDGYRVSVETTHSCVLITNKNQIDDLKGLLKIGAYRCR